jgi:hypothetical protein
MLEDNTSMLKSATIEQLLPQITDDNIHHEIDTSPAIGEEKGDGKIGLIGRIGIDFTNRKRCNVVILKKRCGRFRSPAGG